jgi:hypothetical protein
LTLLELLAYIAGALLFVAGINVYLRRHARRRRAAAA